MNDSLTNHVFFSACLTEKDYKCRKEIEIRLKENGIGVSTIYGTKDIWARDYMPVQIAPNKFVSFIYAPDYLKDENSRYRTELKNIKCAALSKTNTTHCPLILDGGNIVICGSKMILTEKVFRENSEKTPDEITRLLEQAFEKEVVWIPCDPGETTYCHSDGVLSPIDDHTILLGNYADCDPAFRLKLIERLAPHFSIKELTFGDKASENSWIYINYLRVADVVLLPALDEPADDLAVSQIKQFLQTDKVYKIPSRTLTFNKDNGGGSLHCISWNVLI